MAERSKSTKLEEQANKKGDFSYSYWANEVKGAAPAPEPKKISEEEAAAMLRSASAAGASAWNAAGTFEERTIKDEWVQDTIRELSVGATGEPVSGTVATVTEVVSVSGDCCQWVVRGSIRANFDLDVKLKWKAEVDGAMERTGTVRVPNASWDELDDLAIEVEVDKAEGGGEEAARAAARALLPTLRAKLEELLTRIKAYGI